MERLHRTEAERFRSRHCVAGRRALRAGVSLRQQPRRSRGISPPRLRSAWPTRCRAVPRLFVEAGAACEVGDFASVGAAAGHDFSWARYDFKPAPGDALHPLPWSRIVIFERLAGAMVRPILISGDDAAFGYGKPEILRAGGRVVLHVPAYESGTGNFNRELLYAWANDGWRDVDVTGWLAELKQRLPKGLGVLEGRLSRLCDDDGGDAVVARAGRSDLCGGRAGAYRPALARRPDRGDERAARPGRRVRRSAAALSSRA